MPKLAICGGVPIRASLFPSQNTIGPEEKAAAQRVLDSGILTGYQGNWSENFWGGKEVRALEEEWCTKFGVRHAICCNSATSGLFIACGAIGMGHGMDDIDGKYKGGGDAIVTPFSMTCSATVPLGWGAGVRFGDIERNYYCLSADSVREYVVNQAFTKFSAIIPVSLFGQPYDAVGYRKLLADAYKITGRQVYVIEDAAQAVGAMLEWEEDNLASLSDFPSGIIPKIKRKKYAGTLGDIGVYSFNLGKHLTCGEGGMIVTDDDELAMRCRLLMNHAEAAVNDAHTKDSLITNMVGNELCPDDKLGVWKAERFKSLFGFNLRLPEISAAIVRVQLRKMDYMIQQRIDNVAYLVDRLKGIPCLEMPEVREGATHTYYVLPLKYKNEVSFQEQEYVPHRDKFVAAVKAELQPVKDRESEGVTIGAGYIRPISAMPLFGRSLDETPECRRQWQDELIILHRFFGPAASRRDLDDVANAFIKVYEHREELL